MSEEPLVKDGALFFNAPDRKTSKPNVIYYDIASQSTGIEYEKEKPVEKPVVKSTIFRVMMSIGSVAVVMTVLSVIYFFVVKLRKKSEDSVPKGLSDPEEEPNVVLEGTEDEARAVLEETSPEYAETSHEQPPDNYDFIKTSFENFHNGSVTATEIALP